VGGNAVIALDKSCASADEALKQEWTAMKLVDEDVVENREIIP
jgi:hypothetical protein